MKPYAALGLIIGLGIITSGKLPSLIVGGAIVLASISVLLSPSEV